MFQQVSFLSLPAFRDIVVKVVFFGEVFLMTLVGRRPVVLIIEDSASMSSLYAEYLQGEWNIAQAETGAEGLKKLAESVPHVVFLDIRLPDMDGLEILKRIKAGGYPCSVVMMTAHGSVSLAVEAMRLGAFDFIVKPFSSERLVYTLRNAFERRHLEDIVETLSESGVRQYFGFIGSSTVMQAVYRMISAAARSKATVFITGESGTGKELCAEAVHRRSPRAHGPFVALNCGAIPKDLIESEIFGHVKGAYTGAVSDRDGAASRASGGTLFLDEICEMDPSLQTKLLRFIQTGIVQKVGGSKQEEVDVRFVCATNRDPEAEVAEGRFREDLYYRLHVIPLHMPPLREREEDVILIATHLLTQFSEEEGKTFQGFDSDVKAIIKAYHWPGNVRQLQNVVRNIVVLHDAKMVARDMMPQIILDAVSENGASSSAMLSGKGNSTYGGGDDDDGQIQPLWQVEKETIERAIALCEGNIPQAAARLGVSPSTIYRKKIAWESGGG